MLIIQYESVLLCEGGVVVMEVAIMNRVLGQRAGVLDLVFELLPPRDMRNVVLVCQLWREVGEAPRFWVWVVLREDMST